MCNLAKPDQNCLGQSCATRRCAAALLVPTMIGIEFRTHEPLLLLFDTFVLLLSLLPALSAFASQGGGVHWLLLADVKGASVITAAAAAPVAAVLAMILAHMGVFLLVAPWLAKLSGQEAVEGDSSSSSSDAKQQQFISAGLAEAGLYQKLLPEGANA